MKTTEFLILSIFVLFLGVVTFFGTLFPEGNNDLRGESRRAEGFDQIASSGDYKVHVKYGERYMVEVWAESNLLGYIQTEVTDRTLKINTRGFRRLLQNHPIEVFVTTPLLTGIFQSGSGMIRTGHFDSERFSILVSGSGDVDTHINTGKMKAHVSGSGNIFLQGNATEGRFIISGSGRIKSFQATQRNCEAVIFGSGNMYVNTRESIDARISGSGKVLYINNPIVSKSIYGSGDVLDMNEEKGMITARR